MKIEEFRNNDGECWVEDIHMLPDFGSHTSEQRSARHLFLFLSSTKDRDLKKMGTREAMTRRGSRLPAQPKEDVTLLFFCL